MIIIAVVALLMFLLWYGPNKETTLFDKPETQPSTTSMSFTDKMKVAGKFLSKNSNGAYLAGGWLILVIMTGEIFGQAWWDKVFSLIGITAIIGFTLAGYMMPGDPKKPFRATLGVWIMWLFIGVSVWYVLGDKVPSGAEAKETAKTGVSKASGALESIIGAIQRAGETPSRPADVLTAPVGKDKHGPWSEVADVTGRFNLDCEDAPIAALLSNGEIAMVEKSGVPLPYTETLRVQSRTGKSVKCTVFHLSR